MLSSFKGGPGDGAFPYPDLVNVNGTLYGTTYEGGTNCRSGGGCGTVFAITTSGTETVLHSFGGSEDGAYPYAGLLNVKGTLYGTTYEGGATCKSGDGCGTVFAITTSGAETVLHRFAGDSGDGKMPYAGLLNVKGTLYGTTLSGGVNDYGTVFAITPSGTETVLYSFKGGSRDGEYPYADLIDAKGKLYGTTEAGGASARGTVFSITTSGTETILYSFAGPPSDGAHPEASLTNINGTLYGTTFNGGRARHGTAFAIKTSGSETVLHSFGGSGDGENPAAGLVNVNGTLYGTTSRGGTNCRSVGCGTVFSLSP